MHPSATTRSLDRADGQNAGLRRHDDRREGIDVEHAQVADGERGARMSAGVSLLARAAPPSPCAASRCRRARLVGVVDHRGDHGVFDRHRQRRRSPPVAAGCGRCPSCRSCADACAASAPRRRRSGRCASPSRRASSSIFGTAASRATLSAVTSTSRDHEEVRHRRPALRGALGHDAADRDTEPSSRPAARRLRRGWAAARDAGRGGRPRRRRGRQRPPSGCRRRGSRRPDLSLDPRCPRRARAPAARLGRDARACDGAARQVGGSGGAGGGGRSSGHLAPGLARRPLAGGTASPALSSQAIVCPTGHDVARSSRSRRRGCRRSAPRSRRRPCRSRPRGASRPS